MLWAVGNRTYSDTASLLERWLASHTKATVHIWTRRADFSGLAWLHSLTLSRSVVVLVGDTSLSVWHECSDLADPDAISFLDRKDVEVLGLDRSNAASELSAAHPNAWMVEVGGEPIAARIRTPNLTAVGLSRDGDAGTEVSGGDMARLWEKMLDTQSSGVRSKDRLACYLPDFMPPPPLSSATLMR